VKKISRNRRKVAEAWLKDDSIWLDLIPTFSENPTEGWLIIRELVEVAPDDDSLRFLGASALEEFLKMCGEQFVCEVEAYAAESGKFRVALGNVWLSSQSVSHNEAVASFGL